MSESMSEPPDNNEFPTISGFEKGRTWPDGESINPAEIAAGDRIGDFTILEEVGRGGMGVVYKAYETSLKRIVALKALNPNIANAPSLIKRFRCEAVLAANLSHPNIVPVFNIDSGERPRYFTMEFIQGISVKDKIERDGFLSPEQAIGIANQICDALQCAHKHNIIHRDIKPSNVLLENHIERVRVTDFGIAQDISGKLGDLTETAVSTPGTLAFESPEQNMDQRLDVRTDIFSLGMTFYYMLTGRVAYTAKNHAELAIAFRDQTPSPPSSFNPEVSNTLDHIIMKMIVVNKEERYRTVAQIAEALRTAMHENAEIIDATTDETNIDTDVETSSASRTSASGGFSFNTVWHKIFGAKRVSEIPIVIEIKSPASVKSVRAYQPKRNVMRIVIEVTTVCLLISVGLIGTLRIIGTYVLSQFTSVSTTLGPESPSPTATSVEGNSLTIILVIAVFFILFFILLVLFLLVRWLVRRQHKRDT